MSNTLILTGEGYGLSIAPDAEARKAELVKHSALIVEVKDNASAAAARNQVKKLAEMRNMVEKSRKAIKEPVLKIGKDIDAKASEFVDQIAREEKRLTGLIGEHAQEVERQRQEAERERQRIEREAENARREEQRQLAEAQRLRAEAEEKARAAATPEESMEAASAIDLANEKAEVARKAEADRLRFEEQSRQTSLVADTRATSGVRFEYDFEVIDIEQLYKVAPGLVDLSPKRREILATLKSMDHRNQPVELAGLKITKKPVVSTR